jgi:hypothetical protein
MDTKYWGPSGWKLLHLIAAGDSTPAFWNTLPYVLPCKFCRTSLSSYYIEHPFPSSSKESTVQKWLWIIHNKVNTKLRGQGLKVAPNPPFETVNTYYSNLINQPCSKTVFPGWEFLFSIADNHPNHSPSVPMPNYSKDEKTNDDSKLTDLEYKNKWNILSPTERKQQLKKFWEALPDSLPYKEWQTSWKTHAGPISKAVKSRSSALRWLWKIKCGLEKDLNQLGNENFYGLCKQVARKRSGCATSKKAKTCRANTTRKHKSRKSVS